MNAFGGWIGVDFDSTLATSCTGPWRIGRTGDPVPAMVERVKGWLAEGKTVKIFTARMSAPPDDAAAEEAAIRAWCLEHLGQELEVTCMKDYGMIVLYDDRARQVEVDTGRLIGES